MRNSAAGLDEAQAACHLFRTARHLRATRPSFLVRILDGHIARTAVESTRNKHSGREVPREASTVGRDCVPHEWRRRLAAPPVAAGRMAGGNHGVRAGRGHVAGGRAAGRASRWWPRTGWSTRLPYLVVWMLAGVGAALVAAVRAARRARCYADRRGHRRRRVRGVAAAAGAPHAGRLRDAAGARDDGAARGGRAPIPLESVIGEGAVDVPLPADARAEVRVGLATFVVRSGPGSRACARASRPASCGRFARKALLPLEIAALASVLLRGPRTGAQIGEADMRSAIPPDATPLQVEKLAAQRGAAAGAHAAPVLRRHADQLPEAGLRRRQAVAVAHGRDSRTLDRRVLVRRGLPGQSVPVGRGRGLVLRAAAAVDEPGSARCRSCAPTSRCRTAPRARPRTSSARSARRGHASGLTEVDAGRRQPGGTSARDRAAGGEPRLPVQLLAVGDRAQRRRGRGGGAGRGGGRARATAGEGAHERQPSAHGKYVSHRLNVPCASAEAVLALFARLRAVDGVITIL